MLKNIIILLIFISCSFLSYSQKPAVQKNHIRFLSEWYGGLSMHSSGWGVNVTRGKFKTYKITNLYTFELVSMKHPKEVKISYSNKDATPFKFGKLNSLFTARFGYGKKHLLYEKRREKGIEIFGIWSTGLDLGMIKPYYLEILKFDTNGAPLEAKSEEKYDPLIHNQSSIWGKGSFSNGFNEMSFVLGAHLKTGAKFEFASRRERILALEIGVIVDYYPTKVPIMAFNKKNDLFFNLYINVLFGRKLYD